MQELSYVKCKLVSEHKEDKRIQPFERLYHSFICSLAFNKILWNDKLNTHREYKDGFSNDLLKESLILMTTELYQNSRRSFYFGSHPKSKNVKEKLSSFLNK